MKNEVIVIVITLALSVVHVWAINYEQVLTANFIALGYRDVETTARMLPLHIDHVERYPVLRFINDQRCPFSYPVVDIHEARWTEYKYYEHNPFVEYLAGRDPNRIRLVGSAGIAIGVVLSRIAPKKTRIPILIALNIAEMWALGTWGACATFLFPSNKIL